MKNILRILLIALTAAVVAVALLMRLSLLMLGAGVRIIGGMTSRIN